MTEQDEGDDDRADETAEWRASFARFLALGFPEQDATEAADISTGRTSGDCLPVPEPAGEEYERAVQWFRDAGHGEQDARHAAAVAFGQYPSGAIPSAVPSEPEGHTPR